MYRSTRSLTKSIVYIQSVRCVATSCATLDKLGFIGLGNMGMPMAIKLLTAGHEVVACDQNEDAVRKLVLQHAATSAATPAEVASTPGLSAIVTMLPSSRAVLDVYTGPAGLLSARGGVTSPLLIDSSTIDPGTSKRVAAAAQAAALAPGVRPVPSDGSSSDGGRANSPDTPNSSRGSPAVVDAPVSGGVPGAVSGTLTFMAGGAPGAVAAAERYLAAMGNRTLRCGGPGAGQAAKMCNNLVLAISMAAVAEGLALGCTLGLDPGLLTGVFNCSSARCWSSDTYSPAPGVMAGAPSSRGYSGGFAASLMVKDLGLAADAARQSGGQLPLGSEALKLYQQVAEVNPKIDFTAIYKYVYQGGDAEMGWRCGNF